MSDGAAEGRAAPARPRLPGIDLARGAAVVAMVVYHLAWDLSELRLVPIEVTTEPGWRFFARAIAASFLLLVGIGLVLAHPAGIRWRAFARRLALVGGAALVITVATSIVFPDSYIFFGILHAIAVSSLIAVPFSQLPAWLSLVAAAAFAGMPLIVGGPVFDSPLLVFLGLGDRVPVTNDWVPLFPWAAFVFGGIAIAKSARGWLVPPAGAERSGRPWRALAWAGRHSLIIYLLHQPVLFGALSALVSVTGPHPAAEAAPFLRTCARSCAQTGQPEPVCLPTCACAVAEIRTAPALWAAVVAGRLSPEQNAGIGRVARTCFERARGPEPPATEPQSPGRAP